MTEPKATLPVTAQQLEAVAAQLVEWADRLKKAAAVARLQPDETLGIYNWRSVPKGLQLIGGFVRQADKSKMHAELGSPLGIGQLKPRSTKKTKDSPPTSRGEND